jgi:cellulose synthase/poly-beta-1,6-N-acetylglucosamine synthase-like glycosyltransferase
MTFIVVMLIAIPILIPVTIQPFFEFFFYRKRNQRTLHSDLTCIKDCSIVIPAYYPTESQQLTDLINHWSHLVKVSSVTDVIIVINGDGCENFTSELLKKTSSDGRIHVHINPCGNNKASNINIGIGYVRTEIVAFFDADARPTRECIETGLSAMADGVVAVQGANLPSRGKGTDLLSRMVILDYSLKYGATYPMRWNLYRSAYFSGSNGYWRTSLIRDLRFDERMFVEDIDMSARVLSNGGEIRSCPDACCEEEAPPDWKSWALQRYRWAYGWRQIAIRFLPTILRWRNSRALILHWSLALGLNTLARPAAWVTLFLLTIMCGPIRVATIAIAVIWGIGLYSTTNLKRLAAMGTTSWAQDVLIQPWYVWMFLPVYELSLVCIALLGLIKKPSRWHVTKRRT